MNSKDNNPYYKLGIRDAYVNLFMMFAVDGKEATLKQIAIDFSDNIHARNYLDSLPIIKGE